jgi:hypothetical protein
MGSAEMTLPKPKRLDDFPKFVVTALRRCAPSESDYQGFEIDGVFDAELEGPFDEIIGGNCPQWFWLLFGERGSLCPVLRSFDKQSRTATLAFHEKEEPGVLGLEMAYLSSYWQAFHVWMVLDPNWGWERKQFKGTDALAEDFEAKEVSIVEGREIRVWTKLEPARAGSGQSRLYPATDQTPPVHLGPRLVPGAWEHEHCELCNAHIDAEMFGYYDPGERWMCEDCYERYAVRHDLAFVDEI